MCESQDKRPHPEQTTETPQEQTHCLDSAELLGNHREVRIRHGEEIYRLRLTRSGKLILHK